MSYFTQPLLSIYILYSILTGYSSFQWFRGLGILNLKVRSILRTASAVLWSRYKRVWTEAWTSVSIFCYFNFSLTLLKLLLVLQIVWFMRSFNHTWRLTGAVKGILPTMRHIFQRWMKVSSQFHELARPDWTDRIKEHKIGQVPF